MGEKGTARKLTYLYRSVLLMLFCVLMLAGCKESGKKTEEKAPSPTNTTSVQPTNTPTPEIRNWEALNEDETLNRLKLDYACLNRQTVEAYEVDGELLIYSEADDAECELALVNYMTGEIEKEITIAGTTYSGWIKVMPSAAGENGDEVLCVRSTEKLEFIFVDKELNITATIPYEVVEQEEPMISGDRSQLIYASKNDSGKAAVRLESVADGTVRQITDQIEDANYVMLKDVYFDGTVLGVYAYDADYNSVNYFYDIESGEFLRKVNAYLELQTVGDAYLCQYMSIYQEILIGSRLVDKWPQCVDYEGDGAAANCTLFLPEGKDYNDSFVISGVSESVPAEGDSPETTTVTMSDYDYRTGTLLHYAEYAGDLNYAYFRAPVLWDEERSFLVGLAADYECFYVYIWDLAKDTKEASSKKVIYAYSDESKISSEVMVELQTSFDSIFEKYNVKVSLEIDKISGEYGFTSTNVTNPRLIRKALEAIDEAFAHYPENFFTQLAGDNDNILTVYLGGTLTGVIANPAAFYCFDMEHQCIAIDCSQYMSIENTMYHEIWHAIDAFISANYDGDYINEFMDLNGDVCTYDFDFATYEAGGDLKYTLSEDSANAYFVDTYGKTFPAEDRARIAEYAMWKGIDYFEGAPHLLEKLEMLRKQAYACFDTTNWTENFLTDYAKQ